MFSRNLWVLLFGLCVLTISVCGDKEEDKEEPKPEEDDAEAEPKATKETKKKRKSGTEFGKEAGARPSKCHTCRVLAQELLTEMNNTADIKKSYSLVHKLDGETELSRQKTIEYKYSEIRLMDILESVCKNVYNYRSVHGPEFPYLKGVKSLFRQSLEDSVKQHGLQLQLDAPEELIEDPTNELRRMFQMCNQMVELHEDEITEWYMKAQESNPIDYICAERVLDNDKQDCLHASTETPEGTAPPVYLKEGEKPSKFSYESRHKEDL